MAAKKLAHVVVFPQSFSPLSKPISKKKSKKPRPKNFNPARLFLVRP